MHYQQAQRAKQAMIDWLNDPKLNVFMTATLKQSITYERRGSLIREFGNEDRYAACYDQFIRRLSQQVYGAKSYRRHHRLIPNVPSLEGDGYGRSLQVGPKRKTTIAFLNDIQPNEALVHYHLHVTLGRPSWMSFEQFATLIKAVWLRSEWAKTQRSR